MAISNHAFFVDEQLQRHAAEFEQAHRLVVQLRHHMLWIGQSDEGHLVLVPIASEVGGGIWAGVHNFAIALFELWIRAAQLRQVPAAEWSPEATVEHQKHALAAIAR